MRKLLFALLLFPCLSWAQQLAFPSAEGYGRFATGGRGGTVYKVTNLSSSGAGSLNACLTASGPRTCIFDTSGSIDMNGLVQIYNGELTIACQTAPSPGVVLVKGGIRLRAPDIIIRHCAIRGGTEHPSANSNDPCAHFKATATNIIWDHVTCSWSEDESSDMWEGVNRITIQWSIIGPSLHCAGHSKGCHGKGMLIGGDGVAKPYRISVLYNMIAHHEDRVPFFKATNMDFMGNIIYNNGIYAQWFSKEVAYDVNAQGNYHKRGPDTPSQRWGRAWGNFGGSSDIFWDGNCDPVYRPNDTESETANLTVGDGTTVSVSQLATPETLTYDSLGDCFTNRDNVVAKAGPRVPAQWSQDADVMDDFLTGTGSTINSETEVGGYPTVAVNTRPGGFDTDGDGMPDTWETAQGLNPSSASDGPTIAANGWSNLENYLNDLAGDDVTGLTPPSNITSQQHRVQLEQRMQQN